MNVRKLSVARGIICTILTACLSLTASAADNLISYQGRLTDSAGNPVIDSSYNAVFQIYIDSTGGASLWDEAAVISTTDGLFTHLLGSVSPFPSLLFQDNDRLYLQVSVEGDITLPRTRLANVPYALRASNLNVKDVNDSVAIKTYANDHRISIFGFDGDTSVTLRGGVLGDEAAVLPDSSINSSEILDEPGIVVGTNVSQVPLSTISMTDLITVEITIPREGYIVLHGKCYLLLSGTTGANSAHVQIDENEGGSSLFPYYTQAGLGGYVSTATNYFPVYVTRTYYKSAGTYTFRMEGRAVDPSPAEAKTWDHILTAVYYPTDYGAVKSISAEPNGHPHAVPVSSDEPNRTGTYYEIDLRYNERKDKAAP